MSDHTIVDTHVHLWDLDRMSYPWLQELPVLHATHGISDYKAATGDAAIEKFVFVECTVGFDDTKSQEEVRWVTSLARQDTRLQGIVAHASLERGDAVRPHLEWLATEPLVKGVRRLLQDAPSDLFRDPVFIEGIQMLAEFGFTFDLTVRSSQLPEAIKLVERCPQVEFILDHIGKPNIREHEFEAWKEPFSALAKRPNVACKVSGVLTEADLKAWTPAMVQPYVVHAIDCFGIDRVLFGGDWPVLRLAATYSEWLDVLQIALEDYSLPEQRKLYQTNAERVYRLI